MKKMATYGSQKEDICNKESARSKEWATHITSAFLISASNCVLFSRRAEESTICVATSSLVQSG